MIGLECGILGDKVAGLDMVSIGPKSANPCLACVRIVCVIFICTYQVCQCLPIPHPCRGLCANLRASANEAAHTGLRPRVLAAPRALCAAYARALSICIVYAR